MPACSAGSGGKGFGGGRGSGVFLGRPRLAGAVVVLDAAALALALAAFRLLVYPLIIAYSRLALTPGPSGTGAAGAVLLVRWASCLPDGTANVQ